MTDAPTNVSHMPARGGKQTLGDYAYERILRMIVAGEVPENRKLPSETALSSTIGVSRPVLRQALAVLREDGIIASRQGSGSYVVRRPHPSVLRSGPDGSAADIHRCFEFRAAIESSAAALAALRRTPAQMEQMERAVADAIATSSGSIDIEADQRLHLLICEAADNQYFGSAMTEIHAHMLSIMDLGRHALVLRPHAAIDDVNEEHARIVAAIRDRNSEQAAQAMRAHVERARRRVFEDADPAAFTVAGTQHLRPTPTDLAGQ